MEEKVEPQRFIVDFSQLPDFYPTHRHEPKFWEALGRTVATFGFLEEILRKAIFAFTATREYPESEVQAALLSWLPTIEKALSDQLGNLIGSYDEAVNNNAQSTITNLDELIHDLRDAAKIRNVLCHGSWGLPDNLGRSVPFFVSRNNEVFDTAIDVQFLNQLQQKVAELACAVISSVEHMGWTFPGSNGPGKPIWDKKL